MVTVIWFKEDSHMPTQTTVVSQEILSIFIESLINSGCVIMEVK